MSLQWFSSYFELSDIIELIDIFYDSNGTQDEIIKKAFELIVALYSVTVNIANTKSKQYVFSWRFMQPSFYWK